MRLLFSLATLALFFSFLSRSNSSPKSWVMDRPEIDECSGIASSRDNRGILYVHNDSGGTPTVFALSDSGKLMHKIHLKGCRNRDWEDIATGPGPIHGRNYVYVGEIGDNNARYDQIAVYRFPEPRLDNSGQEIRISDLDTLRIRYEDGPRDAEALLIDPLSKDLLIISKREDNVGIYLIPFPQSTTEVNVARKVGTLPFSWVTAADINASGNRILVKTYSSVYSYKRSRRQTVAQALSKRGKVLPYILEPQGEAICFDQTGKARFTLSERRGDQELLLYRYLR